MSPETTTKTKTKTKKKTKKKKKKTKTKVEKQLLKEKFIRLVRRKLIENATFRRAFVNANEYNKIAQSVRVAFREDEEKEDSNGGTTTKEGREKMLHFLDSKSHFLFVVDKVVGQKSEDDDEDVHVNLTEPLETWLRVKNYHRNKFKKLGENAAATIKEKQKAKREAKERVNKARMEKKEKETKEKERKERKRKYHVDLEYYRHKGTCLDWVNTGTCRFGSECTYAHDEEAKGKLIEAAREVEAKTGRERGLRGEYADAKQKKRKREDVLLGDFDDFDDDFDDDGDKDDTIVPGFLKAQMKKSSKARKDDEEERPTLSIRERKLLEKKMKTNANTNGKKNKKFDKTKRVVGRKTPTNNTTKANGVAVTKKKKKERHPDGRHAKRSRARLEQIQ